VSDGELLGPPGIFQVRVSSNVPLCREHFLLTFALSDFPPAAPGQFVQIRCNRARNGLGGPAEGAPTAQGPFLRRPFSIAGLRRAASGVEIDIIGRTIGPATEYLSRLSIGDDTDLLGPLGRPFDAPGRADICILAAGGVGLPPLLWLAERLRTAGRNCVAVCGARSADLLPMRIMGRPDRGGRPTRCVEEYARLGVPTIVTTDDGSLGLCGRAPDAVAACLADAKRRGASVEAFACGPEAMMRAVAERCAAAGVRCQASVERVMGCGMGTCQSCVVRVGDESPRGWHYELCCTQGPVFDAARVLWEASG